MKYRDELDRILGPNMIKKITKLIEKSINKTNLKNMADEMGVTCTFDNHKDKDSFDLITTLYDMLDKVKC